MINLKVNIFNINDLKETLILFNEHFLLEILVNELCLCIRIRTMIYRYNFAISYFNYVYKAISSSSLLLIHSGILISFIKYPGIQALNFY